VSKIFQKRRGLLEEKLEEIDHFREEIEKLEARIEHLSIKSQRHSTELLIEAQRECNKLFEDEELKLQKNASESLALFNKKLEVALQEVEKELSKKKKELSSLIIQKILENSENRAQEKEKDK
jgi:F0F1-type ATP synthase membrane subunit b/b'